MREIKRFQKTTELLIAKKPFARLVREVVQEINADAKIQVSALEALQESTEAFVTGMFESKSANKGNILIEV